MENVIAVYKTVGVTPYQCVQRFKSKYLSYAYQTISYAGRLDPMAEGILLLLVGEENKNRKQYEELRKTYEFTVLLGIETDTYDILGKVISNQFSVFSFQQPINLFSVDQTAKQKTGRLSADNRQLKTDYKKLLHSFLGKRFQPYPPYSSKTVHGKPLYWWARNNRLNEIQIPNKEVEIYELQLLSSNNIKFQDLRSMIQERITKVQGDFRQEHIVQVWEEFFKNNTFETLPILKCRVICSSGTYVRSLAYELGQKLGTEAIALEIRRTKVGQWNIGQALRI